MTRLSDLVQSGMKVCSTSVIKKVGNSGYLYLGKNITEGLVGKTVVILHDDKDTVMVVSE